MTMPAGHLVLICALLLACATKLHAFPVRPNIVFILTDDQGGRDVGYNAQSGVIKTPNLDRLGRSGLTFSQAYAPAANGAPSRAGILSGQYSPRHEVYGVNSTARAPKDHMGLVPTPNAPSLASPLQLAIPHRKNRQCLNGSSGRQKNQVIMGLSLSVAVRPRLPGQPASKGKGDPSPRAAHPQL